MMKRVSIYRGIVLLCGLFLVFSVGSVALGYPVDIDKDSNSIRFDIEEVSPQAIDFEIFICTWYTLFTEGQMGESWIVRAGEDIVDLHFNTWDETDYMIMKHNPFFDVYDYSCTLEIPGGPEGGPQKPYWQELDMYAVNKPGLEQGHYYRIWTNEDAWLHDPYPHGDWERQPFYLHPTPEPATIALFGLGAICIFRRNKRK